MDIQNTGLVLTAVTGNLIQLLFNLLIIVALLGIVTAALVLYFEFVIWIYKSGIHKPITRVWARIRR